MGFARVEFSFSWGLSVKKRLIGCAAIVALASGCGEMGMGMGETTCLTPAGHQTVFDIFNEQVERKMSKVLTGELKLDKGHLRGSIQQVKFEISDVRTSKEDPNSTKKFCTGNLRVSFPANVLDEADETLAVTENGTVSDFADGYDYQRNANGFVIPINYTVQPTDDGESIYAELEDGDNAFDFISGLLAAQILRPRVVEEQINRERQEAEQAKAERDAEAAAVAADLADAKAANQLSEQSINATWGALEQDTRNQLLTVQRAWIKKKETSCQLEAARSSIDETDRQISKLRCTARMNNERDRYLENYLTYTYD